MDKPELVLNLNLNLNLKIKRRNKKSHLTEATVPQTTTSRCHGSLYNKWC